MSKNKSTKSWINKKKSRTYTLISRQVNLDGPIGNEFVLKHVGNESTSKEFEKKENVGVGDGSDIVENEEDDVEEVVGEGEYLDHFDDVNFDEFDMNEGGYDYSVHMKDFGNGTFISRDGNIGVDVTVKEEIVVDDVITPSSPPDLSIDPDLLDAIEHVDDYEELDDNFIKKANLSMSGDDENIVNQRDDVIDEIDEDFTKYDFDIDQDDEEGDPIQPQQYFPKHPEIENGEKTLLEEMFELEMRKEEEKGDKSSSDEEPIPGLLSVAEFNSIFDEFLQSGKKEQYIPDGSIKDIVKNLDQEQEEKSDEEYEIIYVKEKPQWDVESILSTYTNTENHPKLIAIPDEEKKKLN